MAVPAGLTPKTKAIATAVVVFVTALLVARHIVNKRAEADAQNPSAHSATPGAASAGASKLTWKAKTEIFRGNLVCTFYGFAPGGFVYAGPPTDAKTPDDLRRADPQHAGTYTLADGVATFRFPGGVTETHKIGGGLMDSSPLQLVTPFPDGATIEGTYSVMNGGTFGGVHAVGGGAWTFHANGTFTHETFGGVESTPHATGTGSGPAMVVGKTQQLTRGRYRFANGVLTLSTDAGTPTPETYHVWNVGDKTPPWYLNIDGVTFKQSS